jgi:hypothetical protein
MMGRRRVSIAIGAALIGTATVGLGAWFTCRIYVPESRCAVLIRQMGRALPAGQMVATEPGYKGIQVDALGPGRHWRNPLVWNAELHALTVVPAGDPATWKWARTGRSTETDTPLRHENLRFHGEFPMIGLVTRRVGTDAPPGTIVVDRDSGHKGVLREVLTPGTYKLNPYVYDVQLEPAVVIPPGFVGVVTNLFGTMPTTHDSQGVTSPKATDGGNAPPPDASAQGTPPAPGDPSTSDDASAPPADAVDERETMRPLAGPGERGTLRDVLQPGVYFINPKLQRVTLVEIGFNEYSQVKESETVNNRITFPSDTGYHIGVGVTVVWGIHPRHAAEIINEFGNVDRVLDKVIGPQLRSIGRNIGSTYAARDFIQGAKREMFQRELTEELQRVCRAKHVEVLLALVREIEVNAPGTHGANGGEVTEDLKRTIQQSHIAIENQITKEKQREAATVRAKLEEERKKIDIARESIQADSRVIVAKIAAEAEKSAAEIDAQAKLEIAGIHKEVAELDARRTEILGKATAEVEKLKKDAEAKGYALLVDAFGSPQAYNLYTFAENFQPESIRLFFAGEGTFWTDLTRFEEVGAARVLEGRPTSSSPP